MLLVLPKLVVVNGVGLELVELNCADVEIVVGCRGCIRERNWSAGAGFVKRDEHCAKFAGRQVRNLEPNHRRGSVDVSNEWTEQMRGIRGHGLPGTKSLARVPFI